MSDTSQGPGWWQASDGKWYPPEQAPGYQPPTGAPMGAAPAGPGNFDIGAALTWSWAKFQLNMQPLLILGAIVGGVPLVLAIMSGFISGFLGLGFLFISIFAGLVLTMLTVQAGWEIATTGQLNQAEIYKLKGNPMNYAISAILFGILSILGICPGLCVGYVFVWLIFGFWQFACVGEGQGSLAALTRSKDVTLGIGLGNIFVPMLVFLVVGGGAAIASYGSRYGAIIGVFTLPFSALYGSYTYKSFIGQPVAP